MPFNTAASQIRYNNVLSHSNGLMVLLNNLAGRLMVKQVAGEASSLNEEPGRAYLSRSQMRQKVGIVAVSDCRFHDSIKKKSVAMPSFTKGFFVSANRLRIVLQLERQPATRPCRVHSAGIGC